MNFIHVCHDKFTSDMSFSLLILLIKIMILGHDYANQIISKKFLFSSVYHPYSESGKSNTM